MARQTQPPHTEAETTGLESPPTEASGLEFLERKITPGQDEMRRKQLLQWQRSQSPQEWVNLGNGEQVLVRDQMGHRYPGFDETALLHSPHLALKDPKPPWHWGYAPNGKALTSPRYKWFVRIDLKGRIDTRTTQFHASRRIRYIEIDEVDHNSPVATFSQYQTPNNAYACYETFILAEIMDKNLAWQLFKGWEDEAIFRASSLPRDVASGEAGRLAGGVTRSSTHAISVKGPLDTKTGG